MTVKQGKRKVFYDIQTFHTAHAQACHLTCFRYEECVGVNFYNGTDEGDNCDIVFSGSSNLVKSSRWTFYEIN